MKQLELTDEQIEELRSDPIEAMRKQAADPADVPIAAHGDAPNPPGTDVNGNEIDTLESESRRAPVRHDPRATLQPTGTWHANINDVTRR